MTLAIKANLDVAFPYDVSPEEMKIINHPFSCYVLGRSGTGKTTTMLFKIVCIESTFQRLHTAGRRPRQLFVTQSCVLSGKVAEYYGKLSAFLDSASRTLPELQALVDGSEYAVQTRRTLIDTEEEVEWYKDLPDRFSLLEDEHFPLFLTFDKLCTMLEADLHHPQSCPSNGDNVLQDLSPRWTGRFISYIRFLQDYWAHFPQNLTKGLDPALVFGEFMGVIKGSEKALGTKDRHMDRQSYEELGHRSFSTFADQRHTIFDIFSAYTRQKRLNGDFDAADRTQAILLSLRHSDVPGRKVDYLYVDEVQDNLLIDTLLLRSICSNPEGLFWAGDTAQTISIGSSFRFNELKAFIFSVERKRLKRRIPDHDAPKVFQLAVNYRSHGGIVNCAHSVVQLIENFWPNTIDRLKPERGVIDGTKPVFFNGWDEDTMRYEQFLFGDTGNPIEFGAQQCILVRDEEARSRLRQQVGDIGIIMTLYESKGSEFNDVLLYNFFEDSSVELSRWRVVLNALNAQRAPEIAARHTSVCSELKCLYVAITRARKNVWIADCSDKGEPMRKLWTARGLIQNCTPNDVPTLAVASSPEEWETQGRSLFDHRKFFQAKHCFERALLPLEAAVADAYFCREEARKHPNNPTRKADIEKRQEAYITAAQRFMRAAISPPVPDHQSQYYRNAAQCFEDAGDDISAAEAYVRAAEYTTACRLYRRHAAFVPAVDIIQKHRSEVDDRVAETIMDVARLFYLTKHNLECALGCQPCVIDDEGCPLFGRANTLFSSPEEELDYLEDRDLDLARATFLMTLPGKLAEAAEIHLAEGRTLEAIQLFLKDKGNPDSFNKAMESIIQGLWQRVSFRIPIHNTNTEVDVLLRLASEQEPVLLDPSHRDEIQMFLDLKAFSVDRSDAGLAKIQNIGVRFYELRNFSAAILCLDSRFSGFSFDLRSKGLPELVRTLRDFLSYSTLLLNIAFMPDPCRSHAIQKLFGITASNENVVAVHQHTFLHSQVVRYRAPILQVNEKELLVANSIVESVIRTAVKGILRGCVHAVKNACHNAVAFTPCLPFAVFGTCNRFECPEEHRSNGEFNPAHYNQRVRAHLLVILIIHVLSLVETDSDRELVATKRHWLSKLFDALHPTSVLFGTTSVMQPELIPEYADGFAIVRAWTRSHVYDLGHSYNPQSERHFLTDLLRGARLAFTYDRLEAPKYVYNARCIREFNRRPEEYIRTRGQNYVVPEFLASLQGMHQWSVSGGVLFICHVVEKRIPVNLSSFLLFAEFVCASLVVRNNITRGNVIHQVTLPFSWLSATLQTDPWSVTKTNQLFGLFASALGTLLEPAFSGTHADFLLHAGRDLGGLGNRHRSVYSARICRILCFLGYNIAVYSLRQSIHRSIRALNQQGRRFNWLLLNYVTAENWDHLMRAFRQSFTSVPMDHTVEIIHARHKAGPQVPGVRRITYSAPVELFEIFSMNQTANVPCATVQPLATQNQPIPGDTSGVTVQVVPHAPSETQVTPAAASNADQAIRTTAGVTEIDQHIPPEAGLSPAVAEAIHEQPTIDDAVDKAGLAEHGGMLDVQADEKPIDLPVSVHADNTPLEGTVVTNENHDEEEDGLGMELEMDKVLKSAAGNIDAETAAAIVLQAAYKRVLSRRKAQPASDSAALQYFYKLCRDIDSKRQWRNRYYKRYFLGPLPHILLCLDDMHAHVLGLKEKTKKRLTEAKHEELDDLGPRLTRISAAFRLVARLRKSLGPQSSLHEKEDFEALKSGMRELQELVEGFVWGVPEGVTKNLPFGVRAILEEPKPPKPKKEPKPELTMDDYDIYDDDSSDVFARDCEVESSGDLQHDFIESPEWW
ncbi:hypothetical protein HGRIS_007379 [Hohenbuehelia grisea]|uniref:UvrD-like helicase ATP-binding domain-containing protein n=1 Tax=Hohenbuehelia grisea TaxID=104357 RepID=A0ABR3J4M2_9AGAR